MVTVLVLVGSLRYAGVYAYVCFPLHGIYFIGNVLKPYGLRRFFAKLG